MEWFSAWLSHNAIGSGWHREAKRAPDGWLHVFNDMTAPSSRTASKVPLRERRTSVTQIMSSISS